MEENSTPIRCWVRRGVPGCARLPLLLSHPLCSQRELLETSMLVIFGLRGWLIRTGLWRLKAWIIDFEKIASAGISQSFFFSRAQFPQPTLPTSFPSLSVGEPIWAPAMFFFLRGSKDREKDTSGTMRLLQHIVLRDSRNSVVAIPVKQQLQKWYWHKETIPLALTHTFVSTTRCPGSTETWASKTECLEHLFYFCWFWPLPE